MIAAGATVHVATDWPAFGLFFLGLVTTMGGGVGFVMRQINRNRAEWKTFVAHEIQVATAEMKLEITTLAITVNDNSGEIRDQGKAIARIEGALGSRPITIPPPA